MRYRYLLILFSTFIPTYAFSQQSMQDQINAVARADADQQSTEHAVNEKAASERKARISKQQEYEDGLRQVQLNSLQLDLEAKKAVVKRSDEYIDQDLKERAATTDVIQSNADASRNLTEGARDKMKSEGKATEKQAKGFWDF